MQVQNRINTGFKVASAKDNGGVFAIAQSMRSEVGGLRAVTQSLDRVNSATDVAIAASEAMSDLLIEMKEITLSAQIDSLDPASRSVLNEDFKSLRRQLATIIDSADFNGINLLNGTSGDIKALTTSSSGASITVSQEDMRPAGPLITFNYNTASFTSAAQATTLMTQTSASLTNVNAALARLGTASKALEIHKTFVSKLSDTLEKGIGNLVDANMANETARIQALQVKQQLGIQALSIANSAPASILSLFGGDSLS
jgi:flagellin